MELLSTVTAPSELNLGEEALLEEAVTQTVWKVLTDRISSTQPTSKAGVAAAQERLAANLAALDGSPFR